MTKTFLMACLLAAANHACAGWTLLQETREGILYIDRDGAEKTANGWRVDSSQDFHQQQTFDGKEYLSAKSRYELDCAAKKVRALRIEFFAENMAVGDSVYADQKVGDWSAPEKGSQAERLLGSMCP